MLIRSARFDVDEQDAAFPFGDADVWRILVTENGVPRSYVMLADPGPTDDPRLTALALRRAGEIGGLYQSTEVRVAQRIGAPEATPPQSPTCSVILCTHRRPQFVAAALAAIGSLDPPAHEVIVVDNAPGDLDCRVICELAGVRYVREERRGQNWSRAAGLGVATGELVAFTDDDVIVSRAWLRPLAELFADPSVGAVTGIAVGRELQTPAQNLRESFAGFVPGMHRRGFAWTNLRPVSAGAAGAGANMIFRRRLLLDLGEVFPVELDGGTPTRSGGDLYALYRVLAAGCRIVFDPGVYAEHRHRRDWEALRETVVGYGTGFAAFLTKSLVERRELTAPVAWMWLVNRLLESLIWEPVAPYPGLVGLRVDYLRGGLAGPRAWLRSRRMQRDRFPPFEAAARDPRWIAEPPEAPEAGAIEDDAGGEAAARTLPVTPAPAVDVVEIREESAAARNRAVRAAGAAHRDVVLLFLEPDCTCSADLAARHAARHCASSRDRIVIGCSESLVGPDSLSAQLESLWSQDRFQARNRAATFTFADLPPGNFSLPSRLFERLGGFDDSLGTNAAAHELAIRALEAGTEFDYEPLATVAVERATGTRAALSALRRSGADHALIARRHPAVAGALPTTVFPGLDHASLLPAALRHLPSGPILSLGLLVADVLEWGRLRGTWQRLFRRLAQLAYASGYAGAGGTAHYGLDEVAIELDLAATEPLPKPEITPPVVHVSVGSHRLGTFRPRGGQWGAAVAAQAIEKLDAEGFRMLARLHHPHGDPTAPAARLDGTVVAYGPASRDGDDRHAAELIAAGARVARATGHPREHWQALADLIADTREPYVALTLPGVRGDAQWLATTMAPLTGTRVAGVFGVGVPAGARPLPTQLSSQETAQGLYRNIAIAPQFAVVATEMIRRIGGIDASAAHFGMHGPLLDLIQRIFDAGFVVAHQEAVGVDPPGSARPARPRLAWSGAWARGGLLARAAVERGPLRGTALLAAHLIRAPALHLGYALRLGEPSVRSWAGANTARLLGCLNALSTVERWRARAQSAPLPERDDLIEALPLADRQ